METRKPGFIFKALTATILLTISYNSFCQSLDTTIVRTMNISREDVLYAGNFAGDIDIKTWDKNEVKVEYILSTEANSKEELSAFYKQLVRSIEDQQKEITPGKVTVNYPIRNIHINGRKTEVMFTGSKKEYSLIDMKCSLLIHMPAVNSLNVRSSFKKVTIDNLASDATVSLSSSQLVMGNCRVLNLRASFAAHMKVGNVESAKMDINSSSLEMGTVRSDITLKSSFSDFNIGSIGDSANFDLNSCSLQATDIKILDIRGSFIRNFTVNNVEKIALDLNSSKFEANKVDLTEVNKASFSTIMINEINNIKIASSSSSAFSLGQVGSLISDECSFSKFNIDKLKKYFAATARSGNIQILNVFPDFEAINIKGSYVSIDLHVDVKSNYLVSADFTYPNYTFSGLQYNNREKDMSHEVINGWKGNKDQASSKIDLKCRSCNITIN
jgi:hypothetical protein